MENFAHRRYGSKAHIGGIYTAGGISPHSNDGRQPEVFGFLRRH